MCFGFQVQRKVSNHSFKCCGAQGSLTQLSLMKQKMSLLSSMPHDRFLGVVNLQTVFCTIIHQSLKPCESNLLDTVLL
jgi:hypothetical protein